MKRRTAHATFPVVFLLAFVLSASASHVKLSEFARNCGIEASTYSPRVFAESGDGKWKEYESSDKIPLGDPDWSETAFFERKLHRPILVTIQGSGQDFAEYTSYCFDPNGNLTALEREFRTAWGWEFADKRSYDTAGRETIKSHLFDIKTGQIIGRPAGADDVKKALQTKVARRLSNLPFWDVVGEHKIKN